MIRNILLFLILACLALAQTTCQPGFKLVNQNKCLKIFTTHKKHLEAEMDCTQFGGTLATMKNAIDNRAVVNMAASAGEGYTWIGLFCFGNDTSTCYLDDGSGKPAYANFKSGFPKVDSRFGGCVYMATTGDFAGQWVTGPCEVRGLAYVCEAPTTLADPTCTHNYNGYCYLPSHEITGTSPSGTFSNAQQACHENFAELASIHSKQEVDFIRSLYKDSSLNGIYLGAEMKTKSDVFDWTDESRWDYDYSDPLANSTGRCLQMDTSARANNGMWSKTDCGMERQFLCKRRIGSGDEISPKLKKIRPFYPDFSQCNTTVYLAPGYATSFGWPGKPTPSYCHWKLAALGPYRLGLYFTDMSLADELDVYDEYGNLLGKPSGNMNPFEILAPTNIVTMTHDAKEDSSEGYRGFSVDILPY